MKLVPFVKYTSCGNNFVIVDETDHSQLSEADMSRFAFQATSTSFGVGCDNLLVASAGVFPLPCPEQSGSNRYRIYSQARPEPILRASSGKHT